MLSKIITYSLIIFVVLATANSSFAQRDRKTERKEKKEKKEKQRKKKKIEILNADEFIFDEKMGKDVRRLIGNVKIKHEGAIMFCDSAYVFSKTNQMNAYGHIRIKKDKSMNIYGETLVYDGNTGMANVRKNVKLIDDKTILTTEAFDYNLETEYGQYLNFGKTVNEKTTLTSQKGYFYTETKDYYFSGDVILVNENSDMKCDSLRYNTATEMVYFHGPTTIISDSSYIYCERGWHNTKTESSFFKQNALMEQGSQILKADSISYDKTLQIAKCFHNVSMVDTLESFALESHNMIFYEKTDISILTDSAVFINYFDSDTLYLHGDTLKSVLDMSGNRILRAFYNVKMFKSDFQAQCDSLIYSQSDSVITLYSDPVLWSNDNQMTGDSIKIFTSNDELDYFEMNKNALIVSEQDTIGYNQIRGNVVKGYFNNGELSKINVIGAGEAIYYPEDGDEVIGLNNIKCINMMIVIKDSQFDKIVFYKKPVAVLTPLIDVKEEEKTFNNFQWLGHQQPLSKLDIFKKN